MTTVLGLSFLVVGVVLSVVVYCREREKYNEDNYCFFPSNVVVFACDVIAPLFLLYVHHDMVRRQIRFTPILSCLSERCRRTTHATVL